MRKIYSTILVLVSAFALFACVEKAEKVVVLFDTGVDGVTIEKEELNKGEHVLEPTIVLEKEGYVFRYWMLNGSKYDFGNPVFEDLVLVAKWDTETEVANKVTVTFDSNGGSAVNSQRVTIGSKALTPTAPTKVDYEFLYWELNGIKFNFDTIINEAITLVAKWETVVPVIKHIVTFDSAGGTAIDPIDVIEGEKLSIPSTPFIMGKVFVAWQLDGVNYDFSLPVTKPFTLVATYKDREAGDLLDYYQGYGIENEAGSQLKATLKSRLNSGASFKGYNAGSVRNVLHKADKHPTVASSIYTIYDGAAMRFDQNGSSGATVWNNEHVMPKSWYNKTSKYVVREGDLHNLRAAQAKINSDRGNDKFTSGSGKYLARSNGGFYPGDDHKGDSARIAMYMLVMIDDANDLKTPKDVFATGSDASAIQLMLKWHFEDPVDEFETLRNEEIFKVQKNRNPFIDHPELAELVWGAYNASLTTVAKFKTVIATNSIIIDMLTSNELTLPNKSETERY